MIDYPTAELRERVSECIARLQPLDSEAAELVRRFQSFVQETPEGELEEIYTSTFDLHAPCNLYVSHHLLGEDSRRGFFMAKLKEYYAAHEFSMEKELPDHLSVMLRFLSANEHDAEAGELISVCMLPALSKMLEAFDSQKEHPYSTVLQALSSLLQRNADEMKQLETPKQHRVL